MTGVQTCALPISSSFDEKGEFGISAIYAPQNRQRIESLVQEELTKALKEGFREEEVNVAKRGFLEARQVARGQDAALAGRLQSYLVLGRSLDWDRQLENRISELTSEQIVAALRRHIDLRRLSSIKAGDFSPPKTQATLGMAQ